MRERGALPYYIAYKGGAMPKVVDHTKRRGEILKSALKTFAQLGYEETTMTHIATKSGISRPTIYQYFQNKEEILYYAIKVKTDTHLLGYYKIIKEPTHSASTKLELLCQSMLSFMYEQRDFITSLLSYIYHKQLSGETLSTLLRKRTIKLEHLFTTIIKEGVISGELNPVEPTEASGLIWHMFIAIAVEMSAIHYPQEDAEKQLSLYLKLLRKG